MFITDILEKYNLQPSQLRDAVETHLSKTNPQEDPSSRNSIASINLNTNNNMINLNFNLNVAAKNQAQGPREAESPPFKPPSTEIQKNLKQFNIEKVKMQAVFLNEQRNK